jgi:dGTP triphosphohydrolase
LGKFDGLKDLANSLNLDGSVVETLEALKEIFEACEDDVLLDVPDIIRWDIKGKEICIDLAKKLLKAFKEAGKAGKEKGKNTFNVVDKDLRESLRKSYEVGKRIEEEIPDMAGLDDLPLKIAVWDYVAGMTDNYIIREYESLTFKRIDLK